jgi:hypothetical protein
LPEQIGDVRLAANFSYAIWAFEGSPNDLPDAPDYEPHETRFHCDVWGSWLWENGFYSVAPGGEVYAVSGQADQVAVVDFKALVHSRTKIDLRRLTYIACLYGGGDFAGYTIDHDTRTRKSLLVENSDGASPKQMPPASINLTGSDYSGIALAVTSNPSYLYTGQLVVTAVINGKRQRLAIGSPERPYRWVGGAVSTMPIPNAAKAWDWDRVSHRWVEGLDIEAMENS